MKQVTETEFWDATASISARVLGAVNDLRFSWVHFHYPLDGSGRRSLERARDEINRILAEDDERERMRNVA